MPRLNTKLFPYIVPVKVGFAVVAYALKSTVNVLFANVKGDAADFVTVNVGCFVPSAACVSVDMGLLISEILSTLANPTIVLSIP